MAAADLLNLSRIFIKVGAIFGSEYLFVDLENNKLLNIFPTIIRRKIHFGLQFFQHCFSNVSYVGNSVFLEEYIVSVH